MNARVRWTRRPSLRDSALNFGDTPAPHSTLELHYYNNPRTHPQWVTHFLQGYRLWWRLLYLEVGRSHVATLIYLRECMSITVPTARCYRVSNWETDYVLMDFLEGQKLLILRDDLSRAEQISYVQQMASFYTELDRTSFEAIGSLGLGGVVGPLDLLDTVTGPNGRPIGTRLGPYVREFACLTVWLSVLRG
jgi:hypothetical protein